MLLAHVNSCLSASQRYSGFVSEKLEIIGREMPASIRHDFRPYSSLPDAVYSYFDVITGFVKATVQGRYPDKDDRTSSRMTRIRYI